MAHNLTEALKALWCCTEATLRRTCFRTAQISCASILKWHDGRRWWVSVTVSVTRVAASIPNVAFSTLYFVTLGVPRRTSRPQGRATGAPQ